MIVSKEKQRGLELDLTGPQGNAFVLIGLARKLARQIGYTDEDYIGMMLCFQMGDYENVVQEFDRRFGHFVTLYR